MHSLVIFASGRGSNAQAIIDYFKKAGGANVTLIVSNKESAGVLDIARAENIPFLIVDKQAFNDHSLVEKIAQYKPSLIVLAGFLWKIPNSLVTAFSNQIINIHPALLPMYGGKGMYGNHVHQAVLADGKRESGISIHYVNEAYDEGSLILQAHCIVNAEDTVENLADRIHRLEHFFYPNTIAFLLSQFPEKLD
ncbi:MAG: phosphoribosylglycinamide formyltransferase [Bacteroidetes bacterium]|nr:phosphoribosylglycinamide formyltransferase [Bacteroidota bacterium]MBS1740066.1 phosphoribosylglycinamide formyltransferase [Bacteroidota bacterium]MBS1777303.1 phosphoribosylglycinamide formyltransferase [Bacteroidota bacterium]